MFNPTRFSRVSVVLAICLFTFSPACDSADGEGSFDFTYGYPDPDDPNGPYLERTITGTAVSCQPNTSAGAGDPLDGKFFANVLTETPDGHLFSAYIQWKSLTSTPPPGVYTDGEEVTISINLRSGGGDFIRSYEDFSSTVIVTAAGGTIRITLDDTFTPLTGYMQCAD
ncbi:MAG: hypothetical protein ACI8QC_004296 [Planctomycetota bacterium]|jgi:hypothetical protein